MRVQSPKEVQGTRIRRRELSLQNMPSATFFAMEEEEGLVRPAAEIQTSVQYKVVESKFH